MESQSQERITAKEEKEKKEEEEEEEEGTFKPASELVVALRKMQNTVQARVSQYYADTLGLIICQP